MASKFRVVKVKGTNPESFIVVGIDFEKGEISSTSESMREPELRVYLQKEGATEKDADAWIEQARTYPGNPVTPST